MHEPFMGGGLWTATAIPLPPTIGRWPVFLIAIGAMAVWFGPLPVPGMVRRT